MNPLKIEPTKFTPLIDFNADTHQLEIRGESYPENTFDFYSPVFKWINEYLDSVGENKITFNIELIYFNSSSSKILMDLFDLLEEQSETGKSIVVNWIFDEENDSAEEYGEEFQEDMESLEFNLVAKTS